MGVAALWVYLVLSCTRSLIDLSVMPFLVKVPRSIELDIFLRTISLQ